MSWIPHHHTHTYTCMLAHLQTHTLLTAGGTEGALELSKHPKWRSGEVPCSFVSTRLCQGNKCNTVCRLGTASSGVTMWLLGSRSQSRYHGLPLTAPLPWAARHSSPAAQLAALYQFNQPRSPTINQWWCTSVCVGRKVCSEAPLNSPTSTHTRMRNCTTHCTHTHTPTSRMQKAKTCRKSRWFTFETVQGINKSLQQITVDMSKFCSENDLC